jgi:hypothetical protein
MLADQVKAGVSGAEPGIIGGSQQPLAERGKLAANDLGGKADAQQLCSAEPWPISGWQAPHPEDVGRPGNFRGIFLPT